MHVAAACVFPSDTFAAHPGIVSGHIKGKTAEQAQVLTRGCHTVQKYPLAIPFSTVEQSRPFSNLSLEKLTVILYATACSCVFHALLAMLSKS